MRCIVSSSGTVFYSVAKGLKEKKNSEMFGVVEEASWASIVQPPIVGAAGRTTTSLPDVTIAFQG